jgi:hypothetical protein
MLPPFAVTGKFAGSGNVIDTTIVVSRTVRTPREACAYALSAIVGIPLLR